MVAASPGSARTKASGRSALAVPAIPESRYREATPRCGSSPSTEWATPSTDMADLSSSLLWRREELRSAMSVLGVAHSVLGEDPQRGVASRYRDSGMAGTASAEHPDAFVRADLGEAAAMVAAHIRAMRPDVVVTYDAQGGYAHPDHIQTHRVTMLALSALAAAVSYTHLTLPTILRV